MYQTVVYLSVLWCGFHLNTSLGGLEKLLKVTVHLAVPNCPPVRMEQLGCHWTDFHEI